MKMLNERQRKLEEIRKKEIAKHLAIANNIGIAPKLKISSNRRLRELHVLDGNGVIVDGNQ